MEKYINKKLIGKIYRCKLFSDNKQNTCLEASKDYASCWFSLCYNDDSNDT